ncbi:MAG: hypothetical protein U0Q15_17420 [Kineosporiaceae bacterium]
MSAVMSFLVEVKDWLVENGPSSLLYAALWSFLGLAAIGTGMANMADTTRHVLASTQTAPLRGCVTSVLSTSRTGDPLDVRIQVSGPTAFQAEVQTPDAARTTVGTCFPVFRDAEGRVYAGRADWDAVAGDSLACFFGLGMLLMAGFPVAAWRRKRRPPPVPPPASA